MRALSLAIIGLLAATTLLAGCTEYANRSDTISLGAGNAMQANIAVHAVNAFPPHRNIKAIRSDGRIAERNMHLYHGTEAVAAEPAPPPISLPAEP